MNLDDKLKKYFQENFITPDSNIFHYTPPEYGKQIVCSGVLWLSFHKKLNQKNNRELERGIEIILNKLNKTSIKHIKQRFNEYIDRGIQIYIASFCEEENCAYAKKQYGEYYIGFKESYLRQFKNDKSRILLGNVKYDKKEQEKIISEMIQLHEEHHDCPQKKLEDLMIWLSIVTPLLKEESDKPDNECRIVTAQIVHPNNPTQIIGKPCITEILFNKNDIILPPSA